MLIRFLSSLRLTLTLLLGLSFVSAWGTIRPVEGRFEIFYQSLWFRLILSLFALNLLACTFKTILRNLRQRKNHLETLHSEQPFSSPLRYLLPQNTSLSDLENTLRREGYRVTREGDGILGQRLRPGLWGSTLVHISFLIIMLGGLFAEFGFVGTLNIYIGDTSSVFFDWEAQRDRPLGFDFRLDRFEQIYYPKELRFTAMDPETEEVLETYTALEGDTVDLPRSGLTAKILRFELEPPLFLLEISQNSKLLGEYSVTPDNENFGDLPHPGIRLRPIAYRDPILKQLHSEVTILKNGREVSRGVIEVGQPLVYENISIYQTAHNIDDEGRRYAGFQFTKDPGEGLVWAGSILLVFGLITAFFVPYRAVGITRRGEELLLIPLSGFRGDAGTERLESLGEILSRTD